MGINELYLCDLYGGTILTFAPGAPVGVTDQRDEEDITFRLEQNFPNPFNPSTPIRYSLPAGGYVRCSVFNVLGEEVALAFEGIQSAGVHEVTFEDRGLPSGVYFYRLQAPGLLKARRMVLAK